MTPKVLVTRVLPPQTQARLLEQDFDLFQWEEDCCIPRQVLLEKITGTLFFGTIKPFLTRMKNLGVDALFCLLTEKIDQELLDAAGNLIHWSLHSI